MKKALGLFVAIMTLIMALSSCTPAGTPLTLVGKWKADIGYIEILDNDDVYFGLTKSAMSIVGSITKCTCNEVTLSTSWINGTWAYEVSGKTMTLSKDGTKYEFTKAD